MAYTYDDFLSAASGSGLLKEFSQADLDTARNYPEFGLSILNLKKDYRAANTDEQRLLLNEAANELRSSYGNYTGGGDGSRYYSQGKIPGQVDTVLDSIGSFGSYDNPYAEQQKALLDSIVNRPDFSWSAETDPLLPEYRKQYLREGERATANALAQASAATGGIPSSYAVTAANQAGDYYATQLNDIIPTLYQQDYERYLNEQALNQQALSALNTQEQLDYARYLDDYSRLQNTLGALQGQDSADYERYLNERALRAQQEQTEYERAWSEALAAAELGDNSRLAALGINIPTADAGTYQYTPTATPTGDISSAVAAFAAGDHSDEVIAALVAAGYSQEDLAAAGYTGNYFGAGASGYDEVAADLAALKGDGTRGYYLYQVLDAAQEQGKIDPAQKQQLIKQFILRS